MDETCKNGTFFYIRIGKDDDNKALKLYQVKLPRLSYQVKQLTKTKMNVLQKPWSTVFTPIYLTL